MAYIARVDGREFRIDVQEADGGYRIALDGRVMQATVLKPADGSRLTLVIDHKPYSVRIADGGEVVVDGETYRVETADERYRTLLGAISAGQPKSETKVHAPMPGLVIEIEVGEGDVVKRGQGLMIIEAMKMQNEIKAPRDGVVRNIPVAKGQTVNGKDVLAVIE